jgi:membrane associated rhomboid family serine protease
MKYNWYALKLVAICVIVFVLQFTIEGLTDNFALVSSDVLFRPWILMTHIFLHGGIEHLFYNMFALALFGSILERVIGGKKFLIVFFISGIIAGLGSVLFYDASVGASGAIYGIFGTLAVLRPKMTVYVGFGFPMPMVVAVIFWAAGDLLGFFAPEGTVAYAAHLFGLAFGLIYGFYLKKNYGERYKPKRKSRSHISEKEFEEWENNWM